MRKGSLKLHVKGNKRLQTYLQKLVALKAEVTDEAKVAGQYVPRGPLPSFLEGGRERTLGTRLYGV